MPAGRWIGLEQATALTEGGHPVRRATLLERLADPGLLCEIDAISARFLAGEDPLASDEAHVARVLRARAVLHATAPDPDPLDDQLRALDALWGSREPAIWILDDFLWFGCFAGLCSPPPDTWWGSRRDPSVPDAEAVTAALAALARERPPG